MNSYSHKPFIYLGFLCIVLLLVSTVSAQTTATITISGVIKEQQGHIKRPVALFNTDPKVGVAPLTITFIDKSQHEPTRYLWDFGDGTTSTLKNPPAHLYTQPGIYRVKLTASNSAGSDSTIRFVFTLPRGWFTRSNHNR